MRRVRASVTAGAVMAVALSLAGLSAVVFAFLKHASPYVDVREALASRGDNEHLAGSIVPGSVSSDLRAGRVSFDLKDEHGDRLPVLYEGPPPANLGTATKVVAVGGVREGVFHSQKLLLKCPSKYESK